MREHRAPVPPELELDLSGIIEVNVLSQEAEQLVRAVVEQELEDRLDHRALTGRDAQDQHPVEAIEGLKDELMRIPEPTEALTNFELEEILK